MSIPNVNEILLKLTLLWKKKTPKQIDRVPCYLAFMSPFKHAEVETTSSLDFQKWEENLNAIVLEKYHFIPLISLYSINKYLIINI